MTIRLEGLTPLRVELCDKIWGMETQEEVIEWFDTLPNSLKITAHAMLHLIIAEMIDQQEIPTEQFEEVRELLKNYR